MERGFLAERKLERALHEVGLSVRHGDEVEDHLRGIDLVIEKPRLCGVQLTLNDAWAHKLLKAKAGAAALNLPLIFVRLRRLGSIQKAAQVLANLCRFVERGEIGLVVEVGGGRILASKVEEDKILPSML